MYNNVFYYIKLWSESKSSRIGKYKNVVVVGCHGINGNELHMILFKNYTNYILKKYSVIKLLLMYHFKFSKNVVKIAYT